MPKVYKGMRKGARAKVSRFPGGIRGVRKTTGLRGKRVGRLVTVQQKTF